MIAFPPTQEQYDQWLAATVARVEDPADEYMAVDWMDANNVLALALHWYSTKPQSRRTLIHAAPQIIEEAGAKTGTFMGAVRLGQAIGIEAEEAETTMGEIIKGQR